MKGVQEKLDDFSVVGVKPGFMQHEEEGKGSAFETIDQNSFGGKWKIIYFYPKDFTFVCPTEISEFSSLNDDFNDRDAILMGGSTDNEHCKLAWRRAHEDLHELIGRINVPLCPLAGRLLPRSLGGLTSRFAPLPDASLLGLTLILLTWLIIYP